MSPAAEAVLPQKRGSIRAYEIDGEAVLYDLARDSVHYLNRTAWLIWRLCDGKTCTNAISREIAAFFDVRTESCDAPDSIDSATAETLKNLAADGLIDLIDEPHSEDAEGENGSWPS